MAAGAEDDATGSGDRSVDEAHAMAQRTLEAAHGTAWQVRFGFFPTD